MSKSSLQQGTTAKERLREKAQTLYGNTQVAETQQTDVKTTAKDRLRARASMFSAGEEKTSDLLKYAGGVQQRQNYDYAQPDALQAAWNKEHKSTIDLSQSFYEPTTEEVLASLKKNDEAPEKTGDNAKGISDFVPENTSMIPTAEQLVKEKYPSANSIQTNLPKRSAEDNNKPDTSVYTKPKDGYVYDEATGFQLPTTKEVLSSAGNELKSDIGSGILGGIHQGIDMTATSFSGFLNSTFGYVANKLGWKENPWSAFDKFLREEASANTQKYADQMNTSESKAVNTLTSTITYAVPYTIMAFLTQGENVMGDVSRLLSAPQSATYAGNLLQTIASATNQMLKDPNFWTSYIMTSGQSYDDALEMGCNENQAKAYSVLNGFLGSIVEVGGGGIQNIPEALSSKSILKAILSSGLEEATEEPTQGIIERSLQNIVLGANNPIASVTNEKAILNPVTAAKESSLAFITGALMAGASSIIAATAEYRDVYKNVLDADYDEIRATYETMDSSLRAAYARGDTQSVMDVTEQMSLYTNKLRTILTQNNWKAEDGEVDTILSSLDSIDEYVTNARNNAYYVSQTESQPDTSRGSWNSQEGSWSDAQENIPVQDRITGYQNTAEDTSSVIPSYTGLASPSAEVQTQERETTPAVKTYTSDADIAANKNIMENSAAALGENGGKALTHFYDGKTDPAAYFSEFSKLYEAGRAGKDLPSATDTSVLPESQRYSAWASGKKDIPIAQSENVSKPLTLDISTVYTEDEGNKLADKILKKLSKNTRGGGFEIDGKYYIGNGYLVSRVSKSYFDSSPVEKSSNSNVLKNILESATERLSSEPHYYSLSTDMNLYVFDIGDKQLAINAKYAKLFDGNAFFYNPSNMRTGGIKISDSNGETVGIIMPVALKSKVDTSKLMLVSSKSFGKQAADSGITPEKGASNVRQHGGGQQPVQHEGMSSDVGSDRKADGGRPGTGAVLEELPSEDVPEEVSGGNPVRNPGQDGNGVYGAGERHGTGRNGSGRGARSDTGGDLQSSSGEVKEPEIKTGEPGTDTPKGSNFVIGDSLNLPSGEKARYKANIEAIGIVKKCIAEGRPATADEQLALSRYVGWGGLSAAFDSRKTDWEKEYNELKSLLTNDEYSAAKASTLNAHYTSVDVIRAMYDGLRGLGFKGGRMLEPSCGTGNFVGAMPPDMSASVKSWTMVELDPVTGQIARLLYPNANVVIKGFEKTPLPNDIFDAAISNVPFGNFGIADKTYPSSVTGAIHNYFFAKSLDKVRPGGLVMFITSRYTMDASNSGVREYIAGKADLLGAIRLPDTAFKGNAGTEVVTDILILKKREPGTPYTGNRFVHSDYGKIADGNEYKSEYMNEYFRAHPEMMLGTPSMTGTMYDRDTLTFKALPGDLGQQIRDAFKKITGKMDYPAVPSHENVATASIKASGKVKPSGYVAKNGKIYKEKNGELVEETGISEKDAQRITGALGVRDAARDLLGMEQQGAAASAVTAARKKLNTAYDAFVKQFGPLNSQANFRALRDDPDINFLRSLEIYDKATKTAAKADLFTKNTVSKTVTITHVDTSSDALTVSINEKGGVDLPYMSALTGTGADEIAKELLDSGAIFQTRSGKYLTADQYLSGNVRAKLREAEAMASVDKSWQKNVDALKKVIPTDIPYQGISVSPGVTWIPPEIYSDFGAHMTGSINTQWNKHVTVSYNKITGEFTVEHDGSSNRSVENREEWGTPDRSFLQLFTSILNHKNIVVGHTGSDGKYYVDNKATIAANEKADQIRKEFPRWLWEDEKRRNDVTALYNDTQNNIAIPHYDGTHLTVDGANSMKPLRQHQKDVVQRIIASGGNVLIAHKVGAGKTAEMAAACMKLRQLGIVKKPMIVVPKSITGQWGKDFLDFFPTAKLLVANDTDTQSGNRRTFANRIATGDYDAVILSYEQFKALPMSLDSQKEFLTEQITELEMAISESGKRDPSVKQMEKKKKQLEAKLSKLGDMKKDENNISFEELGVDGLFIDEAHNYKNLFYTTNMSNVSGLGSTEGSQRAFDLYGKVRYLQKLNGGRGVVFATATPVMNSMSEMYIMQKYLQNDALQDRGIYNFDAWASQYGEVVNVIEPKPSGKGFRQKQSFSHFRNVAELTQMFRSFADVLTYISDLKLPTVHRHTIKAQPSEFVKNYIDDLDKRATEVSKGHVNPKDDNMLKITSDGRKASYTQRMIDPSLPYEPGNKIELCIKNVYDIWKKTAAKRSTQLVFCDLATPKGEDKSATAELTDEDKENGTEDAENISIYNDIKNQLVSMGIPANEIAFIHDANTADKKTKLYEDMNSGKIRVLIGSTGKMGVGMNAQKKMIALHHLDAPWRPGDIEQREGREIRQGNENSDVDVFTYVTEGTFDTRMWDGLQRKASFINAVMNGNSDVREMEDVGEQALTFAEIKAIASGNPLIQEQVEVSTRLQRLLALKSEYLKSVQKAKSRLEEAHRSELLNKECVSSAKEDLAHIADMTGDNFSATISGKTFSDRAKAGAALISASGKVIKSGADGMQKIGAFGGLDIEADASGNVQLHGSGIYPININADSAVGTAQSLEAALRSIDVKFKQWEISLEKSKDDQKKLAVIADAPFEKQDELDAAVKRNNEILSILNPSEPDETAGLNDEEPDDGADLLIIARQPKKNKLTPAGSIDKNGDTEHLYGALESPEDKWSASRVGESSKTPMPISDIIAKIRHDFGIPINKGGIRTGNTLGIYKPDAKTIRTKISNDLPTVSHELGHYLDHKNKIVLNASTSQKAELSNGLPQAMRDAYSKKKWASEGFAEFLRHYLQNRETAAIDYSVFTPYFREVCKNDIGLIDALADEVNAYYSLDASTASSSIRIGKEGAADFRSFGEKAKDKFDRIYQAFNDSNHGIKLFDRAAGSNTYILASNSAYSDSVAYSLLTGDLTDLDGQRIGPGLIETLKDINVKDDKEYKDFGEYLVVRHGPERLKEGMRIFADDRKNSTGWMEARQSSLEAQYPKFRETADKLYEFQRSFLQTWGVDTGLVSKESFDSWGERWDYYVPLNRVVGNERGNGVKRGFANQDSTIRKARGSGLDIRHPVENIINNMVKMVNAGTRNNVMAQIAKVADKTDGLGSFLEREPMPVQKKTFDATALKENLKQAVSDAELGNDDEKAVFGIIDNLDDILVQYGRGKAHGDTVTVLVDGKPQYWKINDPYLLSSVTNLSPARLSAVLSVYGRTSRFITGNITGSNLVWSIFSNFPRDIMTYMAFSEDKNPLHLFAGIGSAYINSFKGNQADPLFKEYKAMGGGHTSAYTADKNLSNKIRNVMTGNKAQYFNPIEWVEFASDMIELGPRFAYYKTLRNRGLSPQEAFYGSSDVTVNFRRGGQVSRQLNNLIPFFNAGVQGIDKFARWVSGEDAPHGKRASVCKGRVIGFLTVSAILGALAWAINSGSQEKRDDYAQLSNYTKNSYWCIPLGDGKYFTIPKPRELAVMSSFFEALMDRYANKDTHAFDEFYQYFTDQCLPNVLSNVAQGDLSGAIGAFGLFGTFFNLFANRDFLGKPIVSSALENLEPKDQYTSRTSKMAYWIGQAFNISPVRVDYFLTNTLGGYWKVPKALFPVGKENVDYTLGVQNTYVRDNQYSTDLINRLYDGKTASEKAKNSHPDDMSAAVKYKWYSVETDFYSRFNTLSKNLHETDENRETRQTVLNMILEFEKNMENGYVSSDQKFVESFCVKTGTTEYLPSAMQPYVTDDSGIKHPLNSSEYVRYQTEYNRLYWEYIEKTAHTGQSTKDTEAILSAAKKKANTDATANALKRLGITTKAYTEYQEAKSAGISPQEGILFEAAYSSVESEKDENGDTVKGSKQQNVIDLLDSMNLTDEERAYLFSTIYSSDKNNPYK